MAQQYFPNIENYVAVKKVGDINYVKYERGGADARITHNLQLTDQQLQDMLGKLAVADLKNAELKELNKK